MADGAPGEKPWWRRLRGVPPSYDLRPKYTHPPLVGWRLIRRVILVVPAFGFGLVGGFTVDCPGNLALISLALLSIGLVGQLAPAGPWLWSEIWDSGDVNAGKGWIFSSLAPYATAFGAPAFVLSVVRWVLGAPFCPWE